MSGDLIARLRALSEEWHECCGDIHEPLTEAVNALWSLEQERIELRLANMRIAEDAASQIKALRDHAEAMAKVMARIGRAEPCHCARCTAMGEDARQSLAAYRATFPEPTP